VGGGEADILVVDMEQLLSGVIPLWCSGLEIFGGWVLVYATSLISVTAEIDLKGDMRLFWVPELVSWSFARVRQRFTCTQKW
jgi:hypothetical protein